MRHEAAAVADALALLTAEISARTEEMHEGIAGRVYGLVPGSRPVGLIHGAIRSLVHTSITTGVTVAGALGHLAARAVVPAGDGRHLTSRPRGAMLVAAINGVIGDRLVEDGNDLAMPMEVRDRRDGAPLEPSAVGGRSATSKLVLFAPGLCESEHPWWWARDEAGMPLPSFGDRLAADHGWTPRYLRYNSGLPIWRNGTDLDALLERIVDAWPVPLERVALVGHSMGGLVSRSAIVSATARGAAWPHLVTDLVALGSPHLGAPLEQAVAVLTRGLSKLPESRAIGTLLNQRSRGIKDLRYGYLVEDAWAGQEPDDARRDTGRHVDVPVSVRHRLVGATFGSSDGTVLARVVGDGLVPPDSARGRAGARVRVTAEEEDMATLTRFGHMRLAWDPLVYEHVERWLA